MRLEEGSTFKVGDVSGIISAIDVDVVEVSINGQRAKLTLGQSLRDAAPLQ
jgi:hypothetical protein